MNNDKLNIRNIFDLTIEETSRSFDIVTAIIPEVIYKQYPDLESYINSDKLLLSIVDYYKMVVDYPDCHPKIVERSCKVIFHDINPDMSDKVFNVIINTFIILMISNILIYQKSPDSSLVEILTSINEQIPDILSQLFGHDWSEHDLMEDLIDYRRTLRV